MTQLANADQIFSILCRQGFKICFTQFTLFYRVKCGKLFCKTKIKLKCIKINYTKINWIFYYIIAKYKQILLMYFEHNSKLICYLCKTILNLHTFCLANSIQYTCNQKTNEQ